VTKEELATKEELDGFRKHVTSLAALDFLVCLKSDVFVMTHGGNFAKLIIGARRYMGHRLKSIKPDKGLMSKSFGDPYMGWAPFVEDVVVYSPDTFPIQCFFAETPGEESAGTRLPSHLTSPVSRHLPATMPISPTRSRMKQDRTRKVKGAHHDSLGFDVIDEWGRMIPDPGRWPSSKDGKGFSEVANRVHSLGLKFGIHVMRGISTQAVNANTPILDTTTGAAYQESGRVWRAKDIAMPQRACAWMPHGFMSVNTELGAGKAFLRSLYEQYAAWGVDFGTWTTIL
ncbi:Glycoside hydrolase superfamily, partial [Sesbania bispinosa]